MENIKIISTLLRINQWQKNLLVFAPFLFIETITANTIYKFITIFFIFCLSSSLIYIFNDYKDRKIDKKNPYKLNRPLAANLISLKNVARIYILIFIATLLLLYFLNQNKINLYIFIYIAINVFYSIFLKKIFFIDILIVSFGYIIRILSGYELSKIVPNNEIIIGTFLLAMIILLIKRKTEFNKSTYTQTLRFYGQQKLFFTLYLLFNLATIINYYNFILSNEKSFTSLIPVILILSRFIIIIKKKIALNITEVISKDFIIVPCFISWLLILKFY